MIYSRRHTTIGFVVIILMAVGITICSAKDLTNTAYRTLPSSRALADIVVADFYDNMESGFFTNMEKVDTGSFVFDIQSNTIYGYQGSLNLWFYGMCDLRNYQYVEGDALNMAIRWPCGNTNVRPVYSYDNTTWYRVPDGWGKDGDLYRFRIPLTSGVTRAYFAAHYPYTMDRVWMRINKFRNVPEVQSIGTLGYTERDRPIPYLIITDRFLRDVGKARIVLNSGDHGGETASMWGLEGAIDFLLSSDPKAAWLRKKAIFYIVPVLNADAQSMGLDRRQATGVNLYFDYKNFETRESKAMWALVERLKPAVWLDFHSWHLGIPEGMYGPRPSVIGEEAYAPVAPLVAAVGKYFPINNIGPDTLDCPNTQALLRLGVPGFCPEFDMGKGVDGNWKSIADQKALGVKIMNGLYDYLQARYTTVK